LGLIGDARVSALGQCACRARRAALRRRAHSIASTQVATRQVTAAITNYRKMQIAKLYRRGPQREAASDRVLRDGTNRATHRQCSRRRATDCVALMAHLGPRTAVQRQSASECGGDCGGTTRRPLTAAWCECVRTPL